MTCLCSSTEDVKSPLKYYFDYSLCDSKRNALHIFGHIQRKHREQEQRKKTPSDMQVRIKTRHVCIFAVYHSWIAGQTTHVWATALALFMLHITAIIHSTLTLHTVEANRDHHRFQQAAWWMSSQKKSFGCILNSPQQNRANGALSRCSYCCDVSHPTIISSMRLKIVINKSHFTDIHTRMVACEVCIMLKNDRFTVTHYLICLKDHTTVFLLWICITADKLQNMLHQLRVYLFFLS